MTSRCFAESSNLSNRKRAFSLEPAQSSELKAVLKEPIYEAERFYPGRRACSIQIANLVYIMLALQKFVQAFFPKGHVTNCSFCCIVHSIDRISIHEDNGRGFLLQLNEIYRIYQFRISALLFDQYQEIL